MSSLIINPYTFAAAAAPSGSLVYTSSSDSNANTHTFASAALGTAAADRMIVVSIGWADTFFGGNAEITTVTINSVSATRAVRASGDNQSANAEIWYATVASGTTGDIVITNTGGGITRVTIAVYRLTGAYRADTGIGTTTADMHTELNDFAVGVAVRINASAHTLSNFTADYGDATATAASYYGSHGSVVTTAGTFSTTISNSSNSPVIAIAAFRFGTAPAALLLDGMSSTLTGAYSFSRNLVTDFAFTTDARYTDTSSAINTLVDQSGNSRTLSQTSTARPTLTTAGPNSRACADFDGSDDSLASAAAITDFITTTAGYIAISFIADTISANSANVYEGNGIMANINGAMGIYLHNTGTPKSVKSGNYSGTHDASALTGVISVATAYVVEWWHDAGHLYCNINNGTPSDIVSGAGQFYTGGLAFGRGHPSLTPCMDGKIFEIVLCNSLPANRATIAADMKTYIGA